MSVRTMVLLFSHSLMSEQEEEARERWGVGRFAALPAELQERWSQIPPEGPFPADWLDPIWNWIEQETVPGDLVLVHGEPGAILLAVAWCRRHGRIPLYATTRREYTSVPRPDGGVENRHVFRHVQFREYPSLPDDTGTPRSD
ncbi:hypothetical protein CVV65_13805 [Kyrpidia spormannii]|uniref:CRISPR-associated protein n=2 Tax=Kyrpidia spormannii TaxID=2055160 RepID=A0A2K8N959_9BACL|nr:hypothetical protein CVV65_13805 [Kyrpidia spormannii]